VTLVSKTNRPTIDDVARRAGVSKGLVSFALNDRPGVSAETRQRIIAVADELGWRPSLRARSLSSDRAFALGIVLARDPDIIAGDPFFPSFISGVESVLAPAGQALVLSMVEGAEAESRTYRQLASHRRVDGVIISDLRADDARIALVRELGLHAVTLGKPDVASPFPAVTVDDSEGIRASVSHLVGLGHSRIAHVGGPGAMLHGSRRRDSFRLAMRECGLPDDLLVETDFSAAQGAAATGALLERPDRPTAIVYSNDPMAIAGLGVAQRAGLDVPGDLSITGFDGSDVGRYLHPSLTTVSTSARRWGVAAASTLLRLIEGEEAADIDLEPALLVVGESTAPPRASYRGIAAASTH
jgi:DNA-binding LacI/PurR family transcriptional regulator